MVEGLHIWQDCYDCHGGETYCSVYADLNGKRIGDIAYSYYENVVQVKNIYVMPEFRRLGIATKMMDFLHQDCEQYGIKIELSGKTPMGVKFFDKYYKKASIMKNICSLNKTDLNFLRYAFNNEHNFMFVAEALGVSRVQAILLVNPSVRLAAKWDFQKMKQSVFDYARKYKMPLQSVVGKLQRAGVSVALLGALSLPGVAQGGMFGDAVDWASEKGKAGAAYLDNKAIPAVQRGIDKAIPVMQQGLDVAQQGIGRASDAAVGAIHEYGPSVKRQIGKGLSDLGNGLQGNPSPAATPSPKAMPVQSKPNGEPYNLEQDLRGAVRDTGDHVLFHLQQQQERQKEADFQKMLNELRAK
jgi:GNAT superfamily N-acetyltransferase